MLDNSIDVNRTMSLRSLYHGCTKKVDMPPSIAIVIPSFQQARFLDMTLQSVLQQAYPNLQVVVMDGGSTDGSVEIMQRYADSLTYWVSAADGGQADAIHRGFARTDGAIMGWLNSDDVYLPGALHIVGEIFARFPQIAWLTGLNMSIDADGTPRPPTPTAGKYRGLIARGAYHGRMLGFIRQESTFWRRALWERTGGLNTTLHYGMDFDLWRRFARHADLVTVQARLAAFRRHDAQKTAHIDRYYAEIGIMQPAWMRGLYAPFRLALSVTPAYPRVVRNIRTGAWDFRPGAFFRPGIDGALA